MIDEAKNEVITQINPIRLDLGCGQNKKADFTGVDSLNLSGVDVVLDLCAREKPKKGQNKGDFKPWPWEDNSVEEVHCSHFIEHLCPDERIHFCNELYRILKLGGKATVIAPHWCSMRAFGDLSHQWPPISEFFFYYLSEEWRKVNCAHLNHGGPGSYKCNFNCNWGYSLNPNIISRNVEYQNFALGNFKEAASDIISTWVKC